METTYKGKSGHIYTLGDHIKSGGEGGVYLTDSSELVAKIYNPTVQTNAEKMNRLEKKLNYMVDHPVPTKYPNGTVLVTWPQDVLYQGDTFIGYVMPKVSNTQPIYILNRGGKEANKVIPNYDWKKALTVAYNLAELVSYLHKRGIIIGDMNSNNLLVYPNGLVAIIDTDSFDITDDNTGEHFKCSVGMGEYIPPELQGRNLANPSSKFTMQSDNFALAIHIFQLLMKNYHPFNVKVITDYKQSVVENSPEHNITAGNCPYVRNIPNCTIPVGAPVMVDMLPEYLQEDFRAVFDYELDPQAADFYQQLTQSIQRRPTGEKWAEDLKKLLHDSDLVKCEVNSEHYYLRSMGHCELCEAEKHRSTSGPTPPPSPPLPEDGMDDSTKGLNGGKEPSKTKSIWRRILKVVLIIAAILLALFVGLILFVVHEINQDYNDAMNDYSSGNYVSAAQKFDELGEWKSSAAYYEQSMEAIIDYIDNHYNNEDTTTYEYILALQDMNMKAAEEDYDDLYTWRVENSYICNEAGDKVTKISTADRWEAHFVVTGGIPGSYKNFYYKMIPAGEGEFDDKYKKYININNCTKYDLKSALYSSEDPQHGASGKWSLALFDADTDKEIGRASVQVENEIEVMREYINAHYSNTDETTYKYLLKLVDMDINWAEEDYDDLYTWRVVDTYIDTEDRKDVSEITTDDVWTPYFVLEGGTPGSSKKFYLKMIQPGDSDYDTDYIKYITLNANNQQELAAGGEWSFKFPQYGSEGKWIMVLFDASNNKEMGRVSVQVKNLY